MKSMLKSILNVHGASDNYLSCSERACPTWLDSYIYKYVNIPYCWTETYFEYGFIATYIHNSLYSCVYKYNNSHNSYYFVLNKGFSENESNRYNKYTFN